MSIVIVMLGILMMAIGCWTGWITVVAGDVFTLPIAIAVIMFGFGAVTMALGQVLFGLHRLARAIERNGTLRGDAPQRRERIMPAVPTLRPLRPDPSVPASAQGVAKPAADEPHLGRPKPA